MTNATHNFVFRKGIFLKPSNASDPSPQKKETLPHLAETPMVPHPLSITISPLLRKSAFRRGAAASVEINLL